MTRSQLLLLGTVLGLTSCGTMHDAAVSTFRVVDAPHQYIRRQLGMDENDQARTTTTETTYSNDGNAYPPQQQPPPPTSVQRQPFQQYYPSPAPPPPQTQPQIARTQPPPPESRPTATPPRVVTNERRSESKPKPTPTPATTSASASSELPYAKPVPGKPGYVYSPYDPNGGYVDVKGFAPGQKVKDPYSGKIFLVP